MKATPVSFHKILGSHAQSQNSYAPGQGLQKNLKITTLGYVCLYTSH